MSLKKLGVALLAVFVMGAIVANSAYAENEYVAGGQFYKNETTKITSPLSVTLSGGSSFLTSTIATKPIKFSSTGVTGTGCALSNLTTTTATTDCTNLVFSGVTVSGEAAAGCSTPTTITTKEVTAILGMNSAGTLATKKWTPKAGAGAPFATIELTGTCANAGLYKFTGAIYSQLTNATGVFSTSQELTFSEAIQKSAGTATSLKFGENAAFINGGLKGTAASTWGFKKE